MQSMLNGQCRCPSDIFKHHAHCNLVLRNILKVWGNYTCTHENVFNTNQISPDICILSTSTLVNVVFLLFWKPDPNWVSVVICIKENIVTNVIY